MIADASHPTVKRLLWRCRRGTRELDVLLDRFVKQVYPTLDEEEQRRFEGLLEIPDPILNEWFYQEVVPEDQGMAQLVEKILSPN